MRIYLVRHAIAGERTPGADDDARALTPDGVRKMTRNTLALARLGAKIDEIWTSPLLRARQTADILERGLPHAPPIRVVDALRPGGSFDSLADDLGEWSRGTRCGVALVGHEPHLGEFCSWLLFGVRNGGVRFKKGGVACIEIDDWTPPTRGMLLWLLTPRQMAAMR